jgi:hypothetical protein
MSIPNIKPNGNRYWYKNGDLHREDGPAVEWRNGSREWFKNGKTHRNNGPAIENDNGTSFWYKNGKFIPFEGTVL